MVHKILRLFAVGFVLTLNLEVTAAESNARFATKVDIDWENQNVVDGIAEICSEAEIELVINREAINERKLANAEATVRSSGLPLLPALRRIASFSDLYVYAVGNELRLTTAWHARLTEFFQKTYPLRGIQAALTNEEDFYYALEAIETETWLNYGGDGEPRGINNGQVSIYQSAKTHDELAKFFVRAELALRGQPATPPLNRMLQRTLTKKRGVKAGEATLRDQLHTLLNDVPHLIDVAALSKAGISLNTPLPVVARRDQLVTLLTSLCEEHALAWFDDQGIIVITSNDGVASDLVYRVYNIRKHITSSLTPSMMEQKLVNSPEFGDWIDTGGDASCQAFGPLLVIHNDRLSHEKIAKAIE